VNMRVHVFVGLQHDDARLHDTQARNGFPPLSACMLRRARVHLGKQICDVCSTCKQAGG
jgi:hypothetical protein